MDAKEIINGMNKRKMAVVCETLEECDEFYKIIVGELKGFDYGLSTVHNHCKDRCPAIFYGYGGISDCKNIDAYTQAGYNVVMYKDIARSKYKVELI